MFIKTVKLCGLLNIECIKTYDLEFNIEESVNNGNFLNNITDYRLIQAILLIFDLKYDANYNYKNIINKNHKAESYVEICIHQKKENTYSQYDWLGKSKCILKRILQHPKVIYINKKRFDINIFHQSLINLGFHNINNMCIHWLLDEDISYLSKLGGDDFWKMLMKVIEHEELIEMIEQKAGIVKKRTMRRTYGLISETIAQELPKKNNLRMEMFKRIQINRIFITLCYILIERKVSFFEALKDGNTGKIVEAKAQVNAKLYENFEKEKCESKIQMKIRKNKEYLEVLEDICRDLMHLSEYYEDCEESLVGELLSAIGDLTTVKKDEVTLSNVSSESQINHDVTAAKLALAMAAKNDTFDSTKDLLQALNSQNQNYINFLSSEEVQTSIVENQTEFNGNSIADLQKLQFEEISSTLDLLPANQELLHEKLSQINDFQKILDIPDYQFESLVCIENTIKLCPQKVANDYLGPVFQYLNSSSGLDAKMWNEIAPIASTVMFKTDDSLYFFMDQLDVPLKSINLCSIENFEVKLPFENVHDESNFISMKNLVRNETEPENLKDVIFTLLYDYLLVNGSNWEETDETKSFCVKTFEEIVSVCKYNGTVTVQSEWDNKWELIEESPVEISQRYYKVVKEYVEAMDGMKKKRNVLMKSVDELKNKDKRYELLDQQLQAISNKTSKENENQAMLGVVKSIHDKMNQLLKAVTKDECKKWNNDDLKQEMKEIGNACDAFSYYNLIDQFVAENGQMVQELRKFIAEMLCQNITRGSVESQEHSKVLLLESEKLDRLITEKNKLVEEFYGRVGTFMEDYSENVEIIGNLGDLYVNNVMTDIITSCLEGYLDEVAENSIFNFNQKIYDEKYNFDQDVIKELLCQSYRQFLELNKTYRIDLKYLEPKVYQDLIESLNKVRAYSSKEIYAPVRVKKRGFPLMNVMVVKILKDTVHNFTATYNTVLSDYILNSNLYFYTKSALKEVDDCNFSWNCFDITRIKSIDFVEKWKDEKLVLAGSFCQRIKALLLILHIVNYISIFKFVIVSEKFFEGMDVQLKTKLHSVLEHISPFVQIILFSETRDESKMQPMDIEDADGDSFLSE